MRMNRRCRQTYPDYLSIIVGQSRMSRLKMLRILHQSTTTTSPLPSMLSAETNKHHPLMCLLLTLFPLRPGPQLRLRFATTTSLMETWKGRYPWFQKRGEPSYL